MTEKYEPLEVLVSHEMDEDGDEEDVSVIILLRPELKENILRRKKMLDDCRKHDDGVDSLTFSCDSKTARLVFGLVDEDQEDIVNSFTDEDRLISDEGEVVLLDLFWLVRFEVGKRVSTSEFYDYEWSIVQVTKEQADFMDTCISAERAEKRRG